MGVVGFRRIALVTATFAYLQIALGGVVRVSGSGLGCPDWPLCHGRPYPPANLHAIIEYSHRAVGSVTGVLIIATVVLAWVVYRTRRPIVAWLATASLIGVVAEGALGGIVVANELSPWLVVVHLGLAMIILGSLVATAVMSMPPSAGAPDRGFRRLLAVVAALTYVMLLTGSTVVASNADEACRTWPLCGGGFAPDFNGANAFTMLHRGAVFLVGILIVYALVAAIRRWGVRSAIGRSALATLVVFALQITIGAGAAVTGGAFFNGLHVALATLVFAGVLSCALLTQPRTDRSTAMSHLAVEKSSA
ncbi:MAG TPA: COX15/CtaA family protein [Candidatus Dormibacteraeota bacterium]|nr:COX15/CtaA family protein [Candidatus Dormibacteraeota bacterium]